MQIWPEWLNDPNAPTDTAFSRSTSSRTSSAELPPSSRCTRFSRSAAALAMIFPAWVDPVNAITRISGSSTTAAPTSAPPGSTCSTPSGRPASSKIRANTTPPHTAVRGSGLRTTQLPRASAGATDRIDRMIGALNGEITPTTPTGSRRAIDSRSAWLERSSCPYGWLANAADSKHSSDATPRVWNCANGRVAPDSRISHSWISSSCSMKSCPARRSTAARLS
jgi:hypothetical protein